MAPLCFLVLLLAPASALPRVRIPGTQRWFSSSSAPAMAATAVVPAPGIAAVQKSDHSLLTSVGWGALFLSSRMIGAPPPPATRALGVSEAARAPELSAPDNGRVARAAALPPINILCMDGGGILGRNHMVIVEEMEAATGVPASRSFDLVAGTSIGGCGALFLAKYGANATAMARAAMHELQHRCFADRSLRRLLREGHYCADGRKRFILDLCGDDDCASREGLPAFAIAARRCARSRGSLRPYLFRSYAAPAASGVADGTSVAKLWEAVAATSAAPFMFPAAIIGSSDGEDQSSLLSDDAAPTRRWRLRRDWLVGEARGGADDTTAVTGAETFGSLGLDASGAAGSGAMLRLIDGGVVANDPTLLAIAEARALFPGRPIGTVVSLGSGVPTGDLRARAAQARHVRRTRAALRGVAPEATYYRVVPRLPFPVSPIETDEQMLAAMEEATRRGFVASSRGRQLLQTLQRRHRGGTMREGAAVRPAEAARDRVAVMAVASELEG